LDKTWLICISFHCVAARAQDVGSATHDGALACAALGPLPACCAVGPPSCAHSTFEAGSLSPALSLMHFSSPIGAGHTAAGTLPQLCDPPGGPATLGKAGVHGNAISGLTFAPASQPFVDQVNTVAGFLHGPAVILQSHIMLCFNAVVVLQCLPTQPPCPMQALLQDFSAGISGMELLLPTDGLATDSSPILSFHELQ
jgi:hypothetical protein